MSTSEAYTDIVGSVERPEVPRGYLRGQAITKPCPTCGASPYTLCNYSPAVTRPTPCFARIARMSA